MLAAIPELSDEDTDYCSDDLKITECDDDYISEDEEDDDEDLRSGSEHSEDEESSSRSISPAPTVQSITQSLYDSLSLTKHGRMVNATNLMYQLAADRFEVTRQNHEHQLFKLVLGHLFGEELFVGPVEATLADDDGYPDDKLIMDFGTGSAAWAIEMAERFPHVQVLGIDVSPMQPDAATLPLNCRIEVDNLNLDLSHHDSTAHLIHIRVLAAGIKDYPNLIRQSTQCLVPDVGLLHIVEWDYRLYSEPNLNPESIVVVGPGGRHQQQHRQQQQPFSASAHWLSWLSTAMHRKMANCDAGPNLRRWVGESPALEMVECHDAFLPLYPMFPDTTRENKIYNRIGSMVSSDFKQYIFNARPLLLDQFSVDQVDTLERQVDAEHAHPTRQLWFRVCIVCAKRKAMPAQQ